MTTPDVPPAALTEGEREAPSAQDMQSAGPEPRHRVHNHPSGQPICRELFDEQNRLVGDCVREEQDPEGEALVRFFRAHSLDWYDVEGQRKYYCICDDDRYYFDSIEGHAYHLTTALRRSGLLAAREQQWRERIEAVERERDEWRDVSVGPAYATLLTEKLIAAEERLRAAEALADEWEALASKYVDPSDGPIYYAHACRRHADRLRAVLGQFASGEGE